MNRSALIAIGLLVLGLGFLVFRFVNNSNSVRERLAPNSISKSGRGARTLVSPSDSAFGQLRDLQRTSSGPTSFDEIENLAGLLGDDDLRKLIELVGRTEVEGVQGWLRTALWTEWARRDPVAARDALSKVDPFDLSAMVAVHQIHYAVYRGWALKDLDAAYDALTGWIKKHGQRGQHWADLGMQEIMRMRAERDPEKTWREVAGSPSGGAAMKGFFRGLDGGEVAEYVARWQRETWDSDASRKAFARYYSSSPASPNGFIVIPDEEFKAMIVGPALAQHDLDGAIAWLRSDGPGDANYRESRVAGMLRLWAQANPELALSLINHPNYAQHAGVIGHGVMSGNPALASEAVAAMGPEAARVPFQTGHLVAARSPEIHFPIPGENNLIPDTEAHYEALLDAVQTGGFEPGRFDELLENIHSAFRGDLPHAHAAWEAAGN